MDYIRKATLWYSRAREEQDHFVKFVLLYISLEAFMKISHESVRTGLNSREYLLEEINPEIISFLKEKLDYLPLENMNPSGDHRWNGKLRDQSDLEGLVEFLIRGRNNLFHGDKGLDDERDDFVVKYGNKILEPILKKILSETNQ